MINAAVMGYGVVGSGVALLTDMNKELFAKKAGEEVRIKYILDIRDFPGDRFEDRLTKNFEDILNDPEVSVVAETIGGVGVAYQFTKRCLCAGKSVVTSNKELVAAKAPELLKLAYDNNVSYLFEASVGGGIPIISPLRYCLAANRINKIVGILNGTTNYILTKMIREGVSFEDALRNAQKLGYAEADPSADVDGKDSCRKICILASLAFGRHIYPDRVFTKGIRNITLEDIAKADAAGKCVKLLGCAQREDDGTVSIFVCPCAVGKDSALANVEDVFNGITVTGDATGDVTFCGKGAGKMPTASAVCADIIDAVTRTHREDYIMWQDSDDSFVRSADSLVFNYLEDTDIPVIE